MTSVPTTQAAAPQSKLLQTAHRLIEGYNKWDIDAILAPRAPNCTQQVFPARLDRPAHTNEAYRAFFTSIMPLFQNFTAEILDAVEDRANHKVCLHARSTAMTPVGPYANEYMLLLHMTEDDAQIVTFKEFVDSGFSDAFFARLREHVAKEREKESAE